MAQHDLFAVARRECCSKCFVCDRLALLSSPVQALSALKAPCLQPWKHNREHWEGFAEKILWRCSVCRRLILQAVKACRAWHDSVSDVTKAKQYQSQYFWIASAILSSQRHRCSKNTVKSNQVGDIQGCFHIGSVFCCFVFVISLAWSKTKHIFVWC